MISHPESPYRILFTIGSLNALLGSLVWVFFGFGKLDYPSTLHTHLMVQGFLLSFASGFFMTALPRFLGAPPCRPSELIFAAALSICPWAVFVPVARIQFIWLVAFVQVAWLAYFGIRRYLRKEFTPPPTFIFLVLGILAGLIGSLMMFFNYLGGRILVFEGMILAFVLGVGGKLITALLGWQKPMTIEFEERKPGIISKLNPRLTIEALVFVLGILAHALEFTRAGDLCWALSATSLSFGTWRPQRKPRNLGILTWLLWTSSWSILLGLWSYVIFPEYRLHLVHILLVSGLGLITFMVATRVVLAHGGYSLQLELKSKGLLWIGILFFIAMLTRVSAPFFSASSYFHHLLYAGVVFAAGVAIWSSLFVRRIWMKKEIFESENKT